MEDIYFMQAFIILLLYANASLMQECFYTFHDCQDLLSMGHRKSGPYNITPDGGSDGFSVYCDMETDNGGWTVIQRRIDGSVDFNQNWNDYEKGFGGANGEYWLGNIYLHILTSHFDYQLRVDLLDWDNKTAYATYKRFSIGDVKDDYPLYIGGYSGDAGDALRYHNKRRFATYDYDRRDCASKYNGAWWFGDCFQSHLNGEYKQGGEFPHKDKYKNRGIQWRKWKTSKYYSLKKTEMKIKRIY